MHTDPDPPATAQPGQPFTGRLLGMTVFEHHVTLIVRFAGGSVQHVDVAAVPAPGCARRRVAGLRRLLSVHIDLRDGGSGCYLRATTRRPAVRVVPLPVALALAWTESPPR